MDLMHYPPKPVQQPRLPLWCVGILEHKRSLQRTLKCDGLIVEKRGTNEVSAQEIREIKSWVDTHRDASTPFDIVLHGNVAALNRSQLQDRLLPLFDAGATWWIDGLLAATEEIAVERIRRGPPSREM